MLTRPHTDSLANLALFQGLNDKQLDWLAERLRCKTFAAGTNIITVEQPGEVIFFIVSGTVKVHVEQASGNDVTLAILGRGDTVGEMSLLDSAGRSASVVTLEESTLVWMDRQSFQDNLRLVPALAMNLVRILSSRVRLANEQIQTLATLDTRDLELDLAYSLADVARFRVNVYRRLRPARPSCSS